MRDAIWDSLCLPCPPRSNRMAADLAEEHGEWMIKQGLMTHEQTRKHIHRMGMPMLAAWTHPRENWEDVCLAADFFGWLFARDDKIDGNQTDLNQMIVRDRRLFRILEGAPVSNADTPWARALADIINRLAVRTEPEWVTRFCREVRGYLEASRWDAQNMEEGVVPLLSNYHTVRRFAGAVRPSLVLTAIFAGLKPEMAYRAPFMMLVEKCNNHIAWVNDLHSLEKELEEKNYSNLVILLMHHRGLSRERAVNRVIDMCNEEMTAYEELKRNAINRSDDKRAMAAFAMGLDHWCSGHLHWGFSAPRFQAKPDQPLSMVS